MSRLFGTDGVRGLANADLTPELALSVSSATARVLYDQDDSRRRVALVGRDPRASGEMLQAAVTAGLTSAGADVIRVGVLPTPAVAHLVAEMGADLGVMISASHNPMPDNGIKLFAAGGHKLPDAVEDEIAERLDEHGDRPTGAGVGRVRDLDDAVQRYVDHLLVATPQPLDGLRVVVDCANGAAAFAAPAAYRRAGAEVIALNAEPDGLNINEAVGSTHPEGLQEAVVAHGADLGIAHDGDADRCLAVDSSGVLVDGDQIMALLAVALKESGELAEDTLVATVMSNLGLHLAMRDHGIKLRTTAVGDRYVLEELRTGGFALGGEQSGHLVLPGYATTGDGLLTALRLMGRMAGTGEALHTLGKTMTRLPQVLVNVRVADKTVAVSAPTVTAAVAQAEEDLGDTGRVLLRPSGTEQLVRVMVEAPTARTAQDTADRLAEVVGSIR
ncbi:phosphoglucosamine mutase [Saccharopolyspora lacisalsi]|uniref:Phosphoglucosamine mutase n=1 Tax=Halosaccharopolyspora lacisalsi TaxID=1000566 RepID=A0A839E1M2_9PSEU|nr:phosphoglucosamine mutase [Halosaccharopolyspora lacisalsi]MBA8826980.1 phosphoglucosamine mutase [Halosaccharopolyspora lacisalsi]